MSTSNCSQSKSVGVVPTRDEEVALATREHAPRMCSDGLVSRRSLASRSKNLATTACMKWEELALQKKLPHPSPPSLRGLFKLPAPRSCCSHIPGPNALASESCHFWESSHICDSVLRIFLIEVCSCCVHIPGPHPLASEWCHFWESGHIPDSVSRILVIEVSVCK